MTSPNPILKVSFGVLVGLVLGACQQPAAAAIISIEPDDHADGTVLNTIHPGVLLRMYDSVLDNVEPPVVTTIEATDDAHPSTGDRVFSHNGISSFSDIRQLDMTFTAPTDFLSIDFIGSSSILTETGILKIYSSAGTLLDTYTTAPMLDNQVETMSFTRPMADVKFARAYTAPGALPFGRLDNLSFNNLVTVPEPATLVMAAMAVMVVCGTRRRERMVS